MFILVTIFLPQGVLGLIEGIALAAARRAAPLAQPEPAE